MKLTITNCNQCPALNETGDDMGEHCRLIELESGLAEAVELAEAAWGMFGVCADEYPIPVWCPLRRGPVQFGLATQEKEHGGT
jgi:hypothetical protein